MKRLEGKVAIITGAAGGMGEAEARLFVEQGAKVVVTDIQVDILKNWVEKANSLDGNIVWMQHDVTSEEQWEEVIQQTITLYGKVDILVNNAGVYPAGANMQNTTTDLWDKVININLKGPFLGCRVIIPELIKNGGGSIINVSSIAGVVGGNGPAYSASKGGLRLLSKDLAVELAPYHIRVNSLAPGGVKTPMTSFINQIPNADELLKNSCPMGRMAEAMELAYGALFLASDEASFMTGTDLVMDGGLTAR